jgi:hypothetical protein
VPDVAGGGDNGGAQDRESSGIVIEAVVVVVMGVALIDAAGSFDAGFIVPRARTHPKRERRAQDLAYNQDAAVSSAHVPA